MAVGVLLFSALLASQHISQNGDSKNCSTLLIQAGTEVLVCANGNNFQSYLPQVINKTMDPKDLVDKFCNDMNIANCLRNFVNQTNECFDDKQIAGLQIGIKVTDAILNSACSAEERQLIIEELTNEPYCSAVGLLAQETCGKADIIGFKHPFDKEGCKILKDNFNCILKIYEKSDLCSEKSLSHAQKTLDLTYNTTPCGDLQTE